MNTTRAMYSSTEIDRMQEEYDRMQSEERKAYLEDLEAQGLCEYKGQIIGIDEVGDYVQMENERDLDDYLSSLEDDY